MKEDYTMKISHYEVERLPIAVIDNFFNEDEYNQIFNEIDFLFPKYKVKDSKYSGAAKSSETGESLSKANNLWLDHVYSDRECSDILNVNRKCWTIYKDEKRTKIDWFKELTETHKWFDFVRNINTDTTLLSYYEDSDHYHAHIDSALITIITWMYKEEKEFEGGDLIFSDDVQIECMNNRTVFFPSILEHEVSEIKMLSDKPGYGRHAMVQFGAIKL